MNRSDRLAKRQQAAVKPPKCEHQWRMFTADLDECSKCHVQRQGESHHKAAPIDARSPAARDERMRRKGRFPDGTKITSGEYRDGRWQVEISTPQGETFGVQGQSGVHAALEALWGQYQKWLAEQAASAKEAS